MDLRKITDFINLTTPIQEKTQVKPGETAAPQEIESEKVFIKQEPLEELFSWSYEVPNFKIPKKIIRTGFVFLFLFCIFLVLAQDWVFLLAILGMVFLVNLLINNRDSRQMDYKIYSNGIFYGSSFYSWPELSQFFYYEGTTNEIVITSKDSIPGRIYVYFKEEDKEKIDSLLSKYLIKSLVHPKDFYDLIIFKVKPYLNLSDEK